MELIKRFSKKPAYVLSEKDLRWNKFIDEICVKELHELNDIQTNHAHTRIGSHGFVFTKREVSMNNKVISSNDRLMLSRKSLEGLSIGDCFGETFFGEPEDVAKKISNRQIKPAPWHFTDDTIMSICIYKTLEKFGHIRQYELSKLFGLNYLKDCRRGYGGTAHSILQALGRGDDWRKISSEVFDGMGSMGNGAAMRAAPIGAYFFDDVDETVRQARFSAEITHFNEEGIAGAIAVALAAALAVNYKNGAYTRTGNDFILDVAKKVPESNTKYKIEAGQRVEKSSSIEFAVSALGNGLSVMAQDTVPIAIWCVSHFLDNDEEALWKAVSALGDRDTICAIVGGIVVLNSDNYPSEWKLAAENPFESQFI